MAADKPNDTSKPAKDKAEPLFPPGGQGEQVAAQAESMMAGLMRDHKQDGGRGRGGLEANK